MKQTVAALFLSAMSVSAFGQISSSYDYVYEGIFYANNGEMRAKIVANPTNEKYSGKLNIPTFFNITTYNDEGEPIVNSYFVDAVDDGAFEDCTELRSIELPMAVTSFGERAFKGCTDLREFEFPNSPFTPTTIGANAFEGCTSLGEITLGGNIAAIGAETFKGCTDLDYVTVKSTTPPALPADAFDAATLAGKLFVPKSAVAAYKADEIWGKFKSINYIAEYSFVQDGVYYLIDELNTKRCKVTYDNEGCYSGQVNIPEFVINNGMTYTITEVGRDAFRNCVGLTGVTFTENIVGLGINSFEGCTSLEQIELPPFITSLADDVFKNCTSLKTITIPSECAKISQRTFMGCSSLESVALSDEIYLIGANAFRDCTSLKTIVLPQKFELIGINAFQNCTSLEEVNIPASLLTIESESFAGCTGLKRVVCESANPPRLYKENSFSPETYDTASLIVPAGSEEAYKTSQHYEKPDFWYLFKNVNGVNGLADIYASDGAKEIYNLSGMSVGCDVNALPAGIYIVRQGNKVTKIIR